MKLGGGGGGGGQIDKYMYVIMYVNVNGSKI